mgnify:CR=1 FL=1
MVVWFVVPIDPESNVFGKFLRFEIFKYIKKKKYNVENVRHETIPQEVKFTHK